MIRWQSRKDEHKFAVPGQKIVQQSETNIYTVGYPLFSRVTKRELTHQRAGGEDQTVCTTIIERKTALPKNRVPHIKEEIVEQASVPTGVKTMPLLYFPVSEGGVDTIGAINKLQSSAVVEALKTGGVCSSVGALVGAVLWLGFGPAGGFLWCVGTCALAAGAIAGAAQAVECAISNHVRAFAEQVNEMLLDLREHGVTDRLENAYEKLCLQARGFDQKQIMRDVATVCRANLGALQTGFLLATQPLREVPASHFTPPAHIATAGSNWMGSSYGGR